MKRIAVVSAILSVLGALVIPAAQGSPLASSTLSAVWIEPTAGYGFFTTAIASAHHDLDLSMYELKDPTIESLLVREARRGVRVRVVLNADYFGRSENATAAAALRRGGVHVVWAPGGQIFHAKYLVVDDSRAYIGTGNLVDYYYSSTRDFWVLDDGRADVAAIESTFSDDFVGSSRAPVSRGGLVWSPGSALTLESVISAARRTLVVENEEMNNYGVEDALVAAAVRGVRVTVVMSRSSYYLNALTGLARHRVRVILLSSSQLYIHAKAICADCETTGGTLFVGSENFSTSSLDYNRELGVVTRSPMIVKAVSSTIEADAALGSRLVP